MLLDSNIIIYSSQPAFEELREFIRVNNPVVCWINYVEVLGYDKFNEKESKYFEAFFRASRILEIDYEIIQLATSLRKQKMIKLGDALIAATAIHYGLSLVTHNTDDFKHLKQLKVIDPIVRKKK